MQNETTVGKKEVRRKDEEEIMTAIDIRCSGIRNERQPKKCYSRV
jgi:hypothetical protein